jgi:hypothetical protein
MDDDRWERRAAALKTANERYQWKRAAIDKLLAEAEAELDESIKAANDLIPRRRRKPASKIEEKARRIVAASDLRQRAQG